MAKTLPGAMRDSERKKLIEKHAEKRAELRKRLKDPNVLDGREVRDPEGVRQAAAQLLPDPAQPPLRHLGPLAGLLPQVRHLAHRPARSRAAQGMLPGMRKVELVAEEPERERGHPSRLPQGALHRHRHGQRVGDAFDAHVEGEPARWTARKCPVIKLEISSHSHPFWTGKMRELDSRREDRPVPTPLRRGQEGRGQERRGREVGLPWLDAASSRARSPQFGTQRLPLEHRKTNRRFEPESPEVHASSASALRRKVALHASVTTRALRTVSHARRSRSPIC